jgi:hypothetical protein
MAEPLQTGFEVFTEDSVAFLGGADARAMRKHRSAVWQKLWVLMKLSFALIGATKWVKTPEAASSGHH